MKYYKIGFWLLLIINIIILYKYLLTYYEYSSLIKGMNKIENDFYPDRLENHFPKKPETKHQFYLTSFVCENGCLQCNKDEIELLNLFYNKYPENLFINYYGSTKNYLMKLGIKVPLKDVNSIEFLPEFLDDYLNPVSFLVDLNGTIHGFHRATTGVRDKSANFFKRMDSFFNALNDN
jgi:hypothetical protein